jgi:hypothetical protein
MVMLLPQWYCSIDVGSLNGRMPICIDDDKGNYDKGNYSATADVQRGRTPISSVLLLLLLLLLLSPVIAIILLYYHSPLSLSLHLVCGHLLVGVWQLSMH